jgi:hypothetical protein
LEDISEVGQSGTGHTDNNEEPEIQKQTIFTRPLHQKASCTEQITLSFKRVAEKINTSTI